MKVFGKELAAQIVKNAQTAGQYLCHLMLDVIKAKRTPAQVKVDVLALKKEFCGVKYGFQGC
jgi:hypothetical protein